jgi:Rrf2 family protein
MRALVTIAHAYGIHPIKRKDIAKKENISESYLENLLITLKNRGIIYTTRGAKGGYTLARSPQDISLLDIYHALEGSVSPVECLDNPDICDKKNTCVTRTVWDRMQKSLTDVLENTSLNDLLNEDTSSPLTHGVHS